MNVLCTSCRRVIGVPDERAGNPRLKIKCGCGTIFVLGEAALAPAAPQPVPAAAPPVRAAGQPRSAAPPASAPARPVAAPAAAPRPTPPVPPGPDAARVSFQATAAVGEGGA